MHKPYICVSALRPEHIEPVTAHAARTQGRQTSHEIALGVAIDSATANSIPRGRTDTRKLHVLAELADASGRIRNDVAKLSVHMDCRDYSQDGFADYEDLLKRYSVPFAPDLIRASGAMQRDNVHSFQLNGTVRPSELALAAEGVQGTPLIYALGTELVQLGDEAVLAYLDACRTNLAHVLVDLSAGTGRKASLEQMDHLIGLVKRAAPNVTVGVAGGLGPANIQTEYPAVAGRHGKVSFDSESRLRVAGTDAVDLDLVYAWLDNGQNAVAS